MKRMGLGGIVMAVMLCVTACGNKSSGITEDVSQTVGYETAAFSEESAKQEKIKEKDLQDKTETNQNKAEEKADINEVIKNNKEKQQQESGEIKKAEEPKGKDKQEPGAAQSTLETQAAGTSLHTVSHENKDHKDHPGSSADNHTAQRSTSARTHTCSWDGGAVTGQPTCHSTGVKTYTCTGCGKTKTESVVKTSHNYVTENMPATCTESGRTKTYCTNCGEVQSESSNGAPTGHIFEKRYWPSAPTCTSGGSYNIVCATCGANGGSGSDTALPHTPVSKELCHGNCRDYTVIETTCSVCSAPLGTESHTEPSDHNWITDTYEQRNLDTGEIETITWTHCSRCPAVQ